MAENMIVSRETTENTATAFKWKRLDLTVTVSELKTEKDKEKGEPMIKNEGYLAVQSKTERAEIIYLKCSGECCGKLSVKKDDPLHRCAFVAQTEDHDGPDKFIMYELEIPNQPRDEVQPRIILLQSQLEGLDHYFLHWSWPGPAVMCQHLQKFDSNGPKIDINDNSDQKFVWVIPVDTDGSNEFSLKPYDKSCYLTCVGSSGKAVLRQGGQQDQEEYNTFRLSY